jgi:hypothetical protein
VAFETTFHNPRRRDRERTPTHRHHGGRRAQTPLTLAMTANTTYYDELDSGGVATLREHHKIKHDPI